MGLSIEGKGGVSDGGIWFVAVCGTRGCPPFLKCYTGWSNTHSSSITLQRRSALWAQENTVETKEGPENCYNVATLLLYLCQLLGFVVK